MKIDKYELKSGEQLEVFEFVSIGQKGKIPKIVKYSPPLDNFISNIS